MGWEAGIVCGTCDWLNPRTASGCASCGADLSLRESGATDGSSVEVGLPAGEGASESSAEVLEPSTLEVGLARAGTGAEDSAPIEPAATESGLPATPVLPAGPPASRDLATEETVPAADIEEFVAPTLFPTGGGPEAHVGEEVILVRPVTIGPPGGADDKELQMEQARHYVCKSCYSPIPGGHKFCGKCGAPTNFTEDSTTTQYFGAMQVPGKAKLILIRGEGLDGISYHLNSTEHVAGRQQGAILFPDDGWLSPRHANFFYRDNKLFVRDEDSVNGVYARTTGPTPLAGGAMFSSGEQVFRLEMADPIADGPQADSTYFYASPSKSWTFKVVQILRGGVEGMTVHDDAGQLTIGREGCSMNFPTDLYLDHKHARVQVEGGQVVLSDLGSMNGTFTRIQKEKGLSHGDYVFLGKQLLRVEVTP